MFPKIFFVLSRGILCKSATLIDSSIIADDAINALSQLIAMSACMLESEIDNELLLSLHLLNHVCTFFTKNSNVIFV